ncbi:TIGR03364 family FAD-dependent oxidoreductase [Glaciihabitans arcticus]|uniref:TIGR03364 family FAD-dependent oxidoreductase n=1 Tax=Glaciihabitans arcticus TaxID=2668039 RepID=A0A4Q9GT70_9MICO|nr:TIGR03364 family FAD-dependent oxidoreductase [Glaciihabitans arcticus]TBN57901.1 TIGR03364 family FAD-dependent oxidoreductase [Glaciihabitans arcticus]
MNNSFDVVVVGSGIVGLGSAFAAIRRGLSVLVVDRTNVPQGASIRNFGHLCISAQSGEARGYADASRELWLRLSRDADFWLRESGTLIVARHADEFALLQASADDGLLLLSAAEFETTAPIAPGIAVGGAHLTADLQVNPRTAAPAIAAYLESLGVEFRMRTSVGSLEPGRVHTSRGVVEAGTIVVAVNHDIDQLLPELAERVGIVRCSLDMIRVRATVTLDAPLLTGWSLVRYSRFASLPEAAAVRERLHAKRPDLGALDLNQMYTQLPDGSLIIGDTHARGVSVVPFQPEGAAELLLAEAQSLFGIPAPTVIERWQGVYASGPDEFLRVEAEPGILVLAATTGIGMTTGLGLAEHSLAARFGAVASEGTP